MIKSLVIILPFILIQGNVCGQKFCATSYHESMIKSKLPSKFKDFDLQVTKRSHLSTLDRVASTDSILTIPVVAHVIYNISQPIQNISDEQIESQITVLNQDFQRIPNTLGYNTNPIGASIPVSFCLASINPNGQNTTGITRHPVTIDGFDIFKDDSLIKSYGYWPSDQYLNIWVVNFSVVNGNTFLGYAQFPDSTGLPGLSGLNGVTGGSDTASTALTDGVVIGYQYFGKELGTVNFTSQYNLGRTTTHEVGHWLGLRHTWGDQLDCSGDDYCADTPPCSGPYFSLEKHGCQSPLQCSNLPRQIQNYMDYSDDACMNLFTIDQNTRIRTSIKMSPRRRALRQSKGCSGISNLNPTPEGSNDENSLIVVNTTAGNLTLISTMSEEVNIYNLLGTKLYSGEIKVGSNPIYVQAGSGVYILTYGTKRRTVFLE